jgi:hypothetical protein
MSPAARLGVSRRADMSSRRSESQIADFRSQILQFEIWHLRSRRARIGPERDSRAGADCIRGFMSDRPGKKKAPNGAFFYFCRPHAGKTLTRFRSLSKRSYNTTPSILAKMVKSRPMPTFFPG